MAVSIWRRSGGGAPERAEVHGWERRRAAEELGRRGFALECWVGGAELWVKRAATPFGEFRLEAWVA